MNDNFRHSLTQHFDNYPKEQKQKYPDMREAFVWWDALNDQEQDELMETFELSTPRDIYKFYLEKN